ncbi:MAG: cupin protein [Solirubrobacterales bacterium]|nr:cupin protein [Solirubrobacterales bacterium]
MMSEARLQRTDAGLVPAEDGWFVVNAREARWRYGEGRGARLTFEGEPEFPQVGISLFVLAPGHPIGMYHWEADQEDFLVLCGEALLIIEGEERPLRQWDFVHCPAETKHIVVGAGEAPCAVIGVGAREHQAGADWGGYSVDEAALRHGAGVERETNDAGEAYARLPRREPIGYRHGWLFESRVVPSGAGYFLVERAKVPRGTTRAGGASRPDGTSTPRSWTDSPRRHSSSSAARSARAMATTRCWSSTPTTRRRSVPAWPRTHGPTIC